MIMDTLVPKQRTHPLCAYYLIQITLKLTLIREPAL